MPYKPSRQCPGRGPYIRKCPNVISGKELYCDVCNEYLKQEIKLHNKQYDEVRDQKRERKFIHSKRY